MLSQDAYALFINRNNSKFEGLKNQLKLENGNGKTYYFFIIFTLKTAADSKTEYRISIEICV